MGEQTVDNGENRLIIVEEQTVDNGGKRITDYGLVNRG